MTGKHLSHYLIESELGRGGMGIVYRALDTKLDRTVAIKVLPSAALASDDDRARFYREAKAAAQLHHPHIASVFEIDEAVPEGAKDDDLRPFIAMEFVEGETLEDRIKKGPIPLKDAIEITKQVASGLKAAHAKEIVHRDVKAGNIMLSPEGEAKILDFGLAQTAASTKLTQMGSTLGTVAYMSPEQARGEEVDFRTDIWALGAMLYEMVAGIPAFPGDYEQAVVYSILNADPEPLTSLRTGVPMSMDWIVGKLLAKERKARYQSLAEVIVDLTAIDLEAVGVSGGMSRASSMSRSANPVSTHPVAPIAPAEERSRPNTPWLILLAAVAGGLVIGALLMQVTQPDQPELEVREFDKVLHGIHGARYPTLSASGRYLAVGGIDALTGESALFIYDLETDGRVTVPNSTDPLMPRFSKDESQIAFSSQTELKIADLNGAALGVDAYDEWNSKFWDESGNLFYHSNFELKVMRPDGSTESILRIDSTAFGYFPGDMIPGTDLLITIKVSLPDFTSSIVVFDLESRIQTEIELGEPNYVRYVEPGFLLVQQDPTGPVLLYPFSKETLQVSGRPIPVLEEQRLESWSLSDGGHLVRFEDGKPFDNELIVIDLKSQGDGRTPRLLESELAFDDFEVSPDGNVLAVQILNLDGFHHQVVLFDLDSGISNQYTFSGTHTDPTWSPDGSQLAYVKDEDSGTTVYISDIDSPGSAQRIIAARGLIRGINWSPTGEFIAYHEFNTDADTDIAIDTDISIVTLSDNASTIVISGPGAQIYPEISPSGRYIAYQSNESGSPTVHVYDMQLENSHPALQGGGRLPSWSNDGSRLYFIRDGNIYSVSVGTNNGFSVTGAEILEYDGGQTQTFDMTPDGRLVLARLVDREESTLKITWNWNQRLLSPGNSR